ncbi:hypothetical protein PEC301296_10120 [Pectobacterium carotovorum subsp. carotovorum]|nr:hypothetical protein GZ59_15250 [Pectobacterium atrosepticum]POW26176.1 hypothetical protein PB72LOC_03345 [Pectobacterium atrosepticum]GKV84700.1 hypothetical protein PEC301296_10120 [Pectobacterium carotovorum subsp. carotovorum]
MSLNDAKIRSPKPLGKRPNISDSHDSLYLRQVMASIVTVHILRITFPLQQLISIFN